MGRIKDIQIMQEQTGENGIGGFLFESPLLDSAIPAPPCICQCCEQPCGCDCTKCEKKYICENCEYPLDDVEHIGHRCLADENSCVEGKDCPYYVTKCDCKKCEENYRPMEEETCAVCGRYTCADPDCNTDCCQPTLNNGDCTKCKGDN